jgi:Fe-S-cluster-containing dehydrogenase component/CRP-like cAMP-binding protein
MATAISSPRPKRWDRPFGPDMTEGDVLRVVLTLRVFGAIDQTQFPGTLSLQDIIRNDARIRRFRPGEVIIRKGDYGNAVFVVIDGTVREILEEDPVAVERAKKGIHAKRGMLATIGQLWSNARMPERRDVEVYHDRLRHGISARGLRTRRSVGAVDDLIARHATRALGEQEMFGEVAALSRAPHLATVVAESEVELLELRWQGLRDIRRRDKGFRQQIDAQYRASSLKAHLRESPLFQGLHEAALEHLARHTLFETHGEFEWSGGFKEISARATSDIIETEPVIAEHGDYLDGLLLIRYGFGRVSERLDHGHRTVGYVTHNEVFGLREIVDHWRDGHELRLRHGLRAVGFVDLLRVPTALVEDYVLPNIPANRLPPPPSKASIRMAADLTWEQELPFEQSTINFLMNNRTINGTAAMFIDTDRCTACDDCVRACAAAHDNNPRFIRHGPEHHNLMVANACMHCVDPVCLIGCPTGAIHRTPDGLVVIDDVTCIGCATCANSCPYDNIRMVEIRDERGDFVVDQDTQTPIVKATKCDLCLEQPTGPACQRACPHDALVRMDLRDRKFLADWLAR